MAKPKEKGAKTKGPRKRGTAFIFYLEPELRERLERYREGVAKEQAAMLPPGFKARVSAADVVRSFVERGLAGTLDVPPLPPADRKELLDRVVSLVQSNVKTVKGQEWARLVDLRPALAGVFREHQDAALLELEREGRITLGRSDDETSLTDGDRAAAIRKPPRGLFVAAQVSTSKRK